MNTIERNLCIIPARGGSKRIPHKNIKEFMGKPIIAYSIEAAVSSGLFTDVMVSTDDETIAEVARKYGARVPFMRSESASNDLATTLEVLKEVVMQYADESKVFEYVCCIYPTAPFVTSAKIGEAFRLIEEQGYDSVMTVMKYSFPLQRSLTKNSDGKVKFQFPEFQNYRSQDLDESFHDAGQFYWMRQAIVDGDSIITNNTGAICISELEGQDIDNETDWKLAELKYELIQGLK